MEEQKEPEGSLSKEDIEAINKDIQATKDSLVTKESQDAIERAKTMGKEEAAKEFELKSKLDEQERMNKELQEKIAAQEEKAAKELDALKSKVDSMITSKAPIASENPFNKEPALSDEVDKWSNEKVEKFEENSAREFFGQDYDDRV